MQINKTEQIKTHLEEPTKTFIEYDANDRPVRVITARNDAPAGEIALCTEYSYITGSSRVEFQIEYHVNWQAAWDKLPIPVTSIEPERT